MVKKGYFFVQVSQVLKIAESETLEGSCTYKPKSIVYNGRSKRKNGAELSAKLSLAKFERVASGSLRKGGKAADLLSERTALDTKKLRKGERR